MTTIATLPPRARERRFSWAGRAAVAALVALVVYGLWAFSYEVSNGLGVTAMRNIQIWGAYIAAFMFFVGASAGGMIVATIGSIFHVEKLEHLSRYAIWTSLVTIIVAGLSIFPDLGEPQRFWHMFVYANWTSPMIWDVIVVLGYGFFNVVYLWLHMRSDLAGRYRWLGFSAGHGSARAERRYGRIVLGFAYFMLPLAFALHSITAWIIGTQPSHPYWYSTVMAPLFISSALVSGIALVLAVLLVLERQGRLEIGADAQRWLSGFLAVTIAINLFLLIAEAVTVSTGRQPGDWAGLHQLLAGSYAWIYWMEIGTALVALALVAIPRGRASRRFVVLAAALGLVSVAFERIQLIVGGLRFPNIGYAPGISLGTPSQVTTTGVPTASSFVQVAHYGPTWLEWSIVVGLSRRALLTPWRDAARHTAVLDEDRCVGTPCCGACLAACGELALRVEGGALHVDPLRCTSCGRCVPSCPTGALSLPGAALAGIAAELQTLRAEGIDALALTCEHSPASFTPTSERGAEEPAVPVALPCLAMATPGLLLGLLAGGARVELAPCARCPNGHALTHVVGFVERLLHALGRPDLRARLSLPGGSPQAVAVDASDERSAPPPGTLARPAPPGALGLREPMATHGAVVALLDEPGGTRLADEAMFDGGAPGGVVRVESARCSLCGACALACPTAAIALRREDRELIVDAARCLGCGRCAGACPEDAVHVTRGVDLLAGRAGPTALRLPVASWTCAGCGAAVDEDPILAPVAARLAAAGASAALVAGLRRCPSCGAQRLGGAPRLEPAGPGA